MSQAIGTAIVKFITGAAKVNAIVANVVGTAALMVGSNLLTPKARFGNVKERDSLNIRGINSRGATDSRSYIYGQVRVGGTVVYMETTGTDNEFLHMVLVHCDHEVEELGDVYVNDVKVAFDSGSEGSLRNAQGTRYRNSLYIADHLGGPSQTVDSTLDAASGKWYSSDTLSGMAYTYIRMELKTGEDNAFPNGIPTFTRVVKGRKVYDPRLDSTQTGIGGSGSHRADDSTTWEWSDNWALCVADYITSDFGYGRFGNGWSNIKIQELSDSADDCDYMVNQRWTNWSSGEEVTEGTQRLFTGTGYSSVLRAESDGTTGTTEPSGPFTSGQTGISDGTTSWQVVHLSPTGTEARYTINGIIEADEDPLEVVKEIKGAAAGFIEYIGGSWVITSGRYQAPTITLTESDFAGSITGSSKDDRTRSINGVRGVIANKDDAYNVIDVPSISNSAYVTEDNGVESFRDLKLLYTTSTSAAQRLFKIELLRARQTLAFRSTFTASAFRLKAGDTFSLDFDRYGWSGKVFQVWSTQLKVGGDGELVVDMEFRETASAIYDYTSSSDETAVDPAPNTNLPDPFEVTAPTGMTAESGTDQLIETSDGSILPTVLVEWTAAASVNVIGYQIRWKYANLVRDAHYRYLTINGRNNTSSVITGVRESRGDANQYIDIDIRSLTPVKEGEWTVVEHDHDVIGKSAAPTAPTGFAATAIIEGVKLSMDEHPDLDFKQFLIYQNTTNSKPTNYLYTTTDTTKTITGLTAGQQYYFWLAAEDTSGNVTAAASGVQATAQVNSIDLSQPTLAASVEVGQSGIPTDWSDYDMAVSLYVEGASATFTSSTPTTAGQFTITGESSTPSGFTMLSSSSYPTVGIRNSTGAYGNFQLVKTYDVEYMDARGIIHELQVTRQWHIVQRYVLGPPRLNPITLPAKGGSGLDFKINHINATTANDGEVFVAGTTFTKPNGTTTTGITENYVGTPYEGAASPSLSGTVGDVFLMWTDTAANTRFSPLTFAHQNVVPIRESSSGGYEVFNNIGTGQSLTFASTDVLLATVWRDENSTGLTGIEEYIDKNLGQSKNFATGVSGYKIDAETGDAEFNDVTVRGDLVAGTVDIGTGFSRTQIDSNGVSSWAGGRIQINASDSAFGDVGQKWTGSPIESIWIDCNTTSLPANLYFGNVSSGAANAFITGQGNAEFKTLDVTTSLDLNNSTLDASNGVGTSGQVLSSTGTGTQWIDSAAGLWTQTGSDIYYNSGNVGIGTTLGGYKLRVNGTARIEDTLVLGDVGSEGGEINILDQNNGNTNRLVIDVDAAGNSRMFNAGNGNLHLGNLTGGTGETRLYQNALLKVQVKSTQVDIADDLVVGGSVEVDFDLDVTGSKNFRIAHPVRDGHDLRHTCVESPQADLTYRGKATLVDGTVQVNLDSEFGMTAGTFAALNDDVQVFVQNDTGWDAVRGSVSDGVLTINCYNLDSNDSVGWLVIGRRTGIELEIEPETKIK